VEPKPDREELADRRLAFQQFTQARLDRAYRLAAALLHDPDEAEDAVQEAAAQAWNGWRTLRDEHVFDAWFDRILVNRCRDRLRRRSRDARWNGSGSSIQSLAGQALIGCSDSIERIALAEAIAALSPDHRIVVVLRYLQDLSVGEIATSTGLREGTVKSRLHYALGQLHAANDAADRNRGEAR
jgi:RNA polymerase sigma-70 factor, ECF subfamily